MSGLYPPTTILRSKRISGELKKNTLRILMLFLISVFTVQVSFSQETKKAENLPDKKVQDDPAFKKVDSRKRNTPGIDEKITTGSQEDNLNADPKIIEKSEKQRLQELEDARNSGLMAGVQYRVYTNAQGQIAYRVTDAGRVVFDQSLSAVSGNSYTNIAQAEKEAIVAVNIYKRFPGYSQQNLKNEIQQHINLQSAGIAARVQSVLADITFNGGAITINDGNATPYPSTITVSSVPLGSTVKSVTFNGLSHTFPSDIDIVLKSPTGTNVIIMSDAGGGTDIVGVNLTFDDAAAGVLPGTIVSGTYDPTNIGTPDTWVAPGPGALTQANPTLSSFGSGDHNGTWSLYIVDDAGVDVGSMTSWSITFTEPAAVCFPINITSQPSNATVCPGANASFTVGATPAGVTYNWQEDQGSGFVYLTNGGVYSGVNTATLTITGATSGMNGYKYRAVVTCSGGGLPGISNEATLSLLPPGPGAPTVSPPSASICPGGSVALSITSSQGAVPVSASSGAISVAINDNTAVTNDLVIAGFPAVAVASISVNFNITHTWDGDVRINLKAPNGNILNLVNARGGSGDNFTNTTISSTSATSLATGVAPFTGTFAADGANAVGFAPYLSNTTVFSNLFSVPNGTWTLIVSDHAIGDVGTLTSWSITITPVAAPDPAVWTPATGLFNDAGLTSPYVAGTPQVTVYAAPAATQVYSATVSNGVCNSAATNVTVTVNQPTAITTHPTDGNACIGGTKTFSVAATGSSLTYQWQVDAGSGFVNITGAAPTNPSNFLYSGQTTSTLTIRVVLPAMNGYKYRAVVTGACPPPLTSNEVVLAVNSLPLLTVTSDNQCSPAVLTASGADTYLWTPAAGLSGTTGATVTANPTTNTTYTVTGTITATGCQNSATVNVNFVPPTPVVSPASATICVGTVQPLSITTSSLPAIANTTSSGPISVAIPDNEFVTGASHPLVVAGVTGTVQSISVNFTITHTWDADIDINLVAPNGNILNLVGARGGSGDNFTNTTISSTSTTSLATGSAPFTGTFAADGNIGWGPAIYASNVSTFSSLFSVPNGTWRLAMADFAAGDVGTLTSWSITINYATPDVGVWTPITGLFSDPAGTIPYVAGTPASTVYASPVTTTVYTVTVTNAGTATTTFSTGGSVSIPLNAPVATSGAGSPYPSTLAVSGIPATATIKSVTLNGFKHSFPDDVDILLRSPTGVNVVLMSDAGGGFDVTGNNYTFDDAAAGLMADAALNPTGTYRPTNYLITDVYPAPIGSVTQASPALSLFTGDPNGTWSLFVNDAVSGDIGAISGWTITFTLPTPVSCTSAPRTVTVTVHDPIVFTEHPQNTTACENENVTFTVAATGTIETYQWQVSSNGGSTWTPIAGATSASLTLTNVQASMNGYMYRAVLSSVGCGSYFSNAATLTVNPLPTVTLNVSPAGQTQLQPGMQTTLTVTSNPAAVSYVWFQNGIVFPAATGASFVFDAFTLGTFTVEVTDVNGCKNTTNAVTLTALPSSNLFIFPNPNSGQFTVTFFTPQLNLPVNIVLTDMKGRRVVERSGITSAPYTPFVFDLTKNAAGVYVVEFWNSSGNRLAVGRVVIIR
jgi:subtilisin-like proprotein convertase family protein